MKTARSILLSVLIALAVGAILATGALLADGSVPALSTAALSLIIGCSFFGFGGGGHPGWLALVAPLSAAAGLVGFFAVVFSYCAVANRSCF